MSDLLSRIFRIAVFMIVSFIGMFTVFLIALVAVPVMLCLSLWFILRRKPFSPGDFMKKSTRKARQTSKSFNDKFKKTGDSRIHRPPASEIVDVDLK